MPHFLSLPTEAHSIIAGYIGQTGLYQLSLTSRACKNQYESSLYVHPEVRKMTAAITLWTAIQIEPELAKKVKSITVNDLASVVTALACCGNLKNLTMSMLGAALEFRLFLGNMSIPGRLRAAFDRLKIITIDYSSGSVYGAMVLQTLPQLMQLQSLEEFTLYGHGFVETGVLGTITNIPRGCSNIRVLRIDAPMKSNYITAIIIGCRPGRLEHLGLGEPWIEQDFLAAMAAHGNSLRSLVLLRSGGIHSHLDELPLTCDSVKILAVAKGLVEQHLPRNIRWLAVQLGLGTTHMDVLHQLLAIQQEMAHDKIPKVQKISISRYRMIGPLALSASGDVILSARQLATERQDIAKIRQHMNELADKGVTVTVADHIAMTGLIGPEHLKFDKHWNNMFRDMDRLMELFPDKEDDGDGEDTEVEIYGHREPGSVTYNVHALQDELEWIGDALVKKHNHEELVTGLLDSEI